MAAVRDLVPVSRRVPVLRPREVAIAVARRAVPVVTASAGALVATLAAERALANLATRAVGQVAPRRAQPVAEAVIRRTVFIETVVIERITRRRA
jgi:hypothetical protein